MLPPVPPIMGMVPVALGLLWRSLAGAGAQHSEGMGCRAGAEKLLKVVSCGGVLWEQQSRSAGGDGSVPLLQPSAPVALQVSAGVGLLAVRGGRSGRDSGMKPVKK